MKKRTIASSILSLSILAFMAFSPTSDNGKAGYTNSPNESNCTNAGCHVGSAANSGGGSITFSSTMPNWQYTPGQTYQVTVTVAQTGRSLFGFGCEALLASNANAGTLAVTSSTMRILTAGNGRKNVTHNLNGGASANSKAFTFNWTAPAAGSGAVTFYSAAVAANANGSESGDLVYTKTQAATELVVSTENKISTNAFELSVLPTVTEDMAQIKYKLPANEQVSIDVYAMNGQKISSLLNEKQVSGEHILPLSVSDLESGIYFVLLQVGKTQSIQKIVVP